MHVAHCTAARTSFNHTVTCKRMLLQVEKAPVVVKAAVSKADAESMKKQLEAGASWPADRVGARGSASSWLRCPAAAPCHPLTDAVRCAACMLL
jgi:hypothetical protein